MKVTLPSIESSVIKPEAEATEDRRRRAESILSATGAPQGDQTTEVRSISV